MNNRRTAFGRDASHSPLVRARNMTAGLVSLGIFAGFSGSCSAPMVGLDPRSLVAQTGEANVTLSGWFAAGVELLQSDTCAASEHFRSTAPAGGSAPEVLLFARLGSLASALCDASQPTFPVASPADGTIGIVTQEQGPWMWGNQVFTFETIQGSSTLRPGRDEAAPGWCGATWVSATIEVWPVGGSPVGLRAPDNATLIVSPPAGGVPDCPQERGNFVMTAVQDAPSFSYRLVGSVDDPPDTVEIGNVSPAATINWNGGISAMLLVDISPTVTADTIYAGCPGFVTLLPSLQIVSAQQSEYAVSIRTHSDLDAVLLVRSPDGTMSCDDDSAGGLNSMIQMPLQAGTTDVWVGTFSGDSLPAVTVEVY